MHAARSLLLGTLAMALMVWAFDCSGATSADEAMDCCNSMPCSHEHGKDCCKDMAYQHAPYVKPSAVRGALSSSLVVSVLLGSRETSIPNSIVAQAGWHNHWTLGTSPPLLIPLRI